MRKAIHVVIAIGIFVSVACATSPDKKIVNAPMVPVATMTSPLSDASSAAAGPATKRLECGGLMQRGSFCDVLTEVRRAMKTDGDGRRCLRGGSRNATSALPSISMACHARRPWDEDCAGNKPKQSDVVVDCRFYIGDDETLGYEYDDRNHDMIDYLRNISAAITACDSGYRALPMRSVGERDKAIQFSRFEPGSTSQEVVAVCSELVTPLPNEPETPDESKNPRYYIIMQVYGITAPSPQAKWDYAVNRWSQLPAPEDTEFRKHILNKTTPRQAHMLVGAAFSGEHPDEDLLNRVYLNPDLLLKK